MDQSNHVYRYYSNLKKLDQSKWMCILKIQWYKLSHCHNLQNHMEESFLKMNNRSLRFTILNCGCIFFQPIRDKILFYYRSLWPRVLDTLYAYPSWFTSYDSYNNNCDMFVNCLINIFVLFNQLGKHAFQCVISYTRLLAHSK